MHCSAQTSPLHVLQKLQQCCMVISSNTGRVYRPKDCERLVLYLKDLNLPKPDKWGTSQLIAFLQQVSRCLENVSNLPKLNLKVLEGRKFLFIKKLSFLMVRFGSSNCYKEGENDNGRRDWGGGKGAPFILILKYHIYGNAW